MKTQSLEELTDRYIGKKGTPKRESFDYELKMDRLREAIKKVRKRS